MNKHLKNLNRIEFVVTNACTGKCIHCSQGEHKSSETLDKDIAADIVRKIAKEHSIESVMTFGGEPLLAPECVYEIHKAAKEMNIAKRQLITNGFFSKNYEKINSVAEKVKESGINEILISVDAFHQETIPIEYVRAFANAVNVPSIRVLIHPAWLAAPEADNPYNRKTKELLAQFRKAGFQISEGNVIFPSGNALKYLSEYFDMSKKVQNPYQEDPNDIKAICISANGDILGNNVYKNDISNILESYKI